MLRGKAGSKDDGKAGRSSSSDEGACSDNSGSDGNAGDGGGGDEYDSRLAEVWLQLELLRERRNWLPYAKDPDDCEDPDTMVAFEHLAPFVTALPLATSSDDPKRRDLQYEKFYIVLRFLEFLGVDVAEIERRYFNSLEIGDYHIHSFDNSQLEDLDSLFSSEVLSVCSEYGRLGRLLPSVGPSLADPDCDSFFRFICNVINSTMPSFNAQYGGYLAVLYIRLMIQRYRAFQKLKMEAKDLNKIEKSFEKLSKRVLKKDLFRNNLLIYREYGALEECFGNFMEAEKVYITALVMGCENIDVFNCEPVIFQQIFGVVLSYIQLHLTSAAVQTAVDARVHTSSVASIICALVNDGGLKQPDLPLVQPANMLRAKRKLVEMLELSLRSCSSNKLKRLSVWNTLLVVVLTTFLALVQFLSSGVKAFCLTFEDTITKVTDSSSAELGSDDAIVQEGTLGTSAQLLSEDRPNSCYSAVQSLQERYVWLLALLQRVPGGAVPPALRRATVHAALDTAPHNTLLLAIMAQLQVCYPPVFIYDINH